MATTLQWREWERKWEREREEVSGRVTESVKERESEGKVERQSEKKSEREEKRGGWISKKAVVELLFSRSGFCFHFLFFIHFEYKCAHGPQLVLVAGGVRGKLATSHLSLRLVPPS